MGTRSGRGADSGHPSVVWLTLRSRPRRGVLNTGHCHTGNDVRYLPVFGHAEARFTVSAYSHELTLMA